MYVQITIEINGKSFELVPCKAYDGVQLAGERLKDLKDGYLLKPVEEKKPIKAEVIWLNHHEGGTTITRDNPKPFFKNEKFVRPMKREDVARYIDDGVFIESERLALICNRLEGLGLIQEGEG